MKKIITGFLAGALSMLIVWGALREESAGFQPKVAVSLKGAQLSYGDLRKDAMSDLVPVENDEYSILETAAQNWVREQVLNAEMKALHASSREDVFQKQIWSKVHVSYEQVRSHYDKNREVYGAAFDQVQSSISQELRRRAYVDAKEAYLKDLIKKYEVKINLRKPGSYVEGLAIARQGANPSAPNVPSLQFMPPQPAVVPAPAPAPAAAPQPAANPVVNQDVAGRPFTGTTNAPVTIVQFSDYHCPFCQRVEPTIDQIRQTYGDKVRVVWRHFPLPFHKGADRTHAAAECAHEQGKFWQYHKELFANMGGDRSDAGLSGIAAKVGLDQAKFKQCLESGRMNAVVQKDMAAGQQAGVNGTPAAFVNGREVSGAVPFEQFKVLIDGFLSGNPPPLPAPAAPAPANAGQPTVFTDLAGRPTMGNPNAKVTLVEFSDFHCSFCGRHAPNLEKLVKQYPNDVKLVWRSYPLSFHQGADQTSAAAECAHQQGKFWQYHDEIFATMQGGDRSDAGLNAMAAKIGLDQAKFKQCLDSGSAKAIVQSDLAAGTKAGVNGTPATFVNGRLISGALPYERFDAIVSSLIKTGNFPPDTPAAPTPSAPAGPVTFDDLADRPFKGAANAPVTLVQFSDYHCPFCTRVEATIKQIMDAFPGKVKVVWRHNPLPFHTGADKTHAAAECAFEQGRFWQYHDELFAGQNVDHSDAGLDAIAKKVGLNEGKFKECLSSGRKKAMVDKDLAAGAKAGVRGTPATFVNGVLVSGAQPFEAFKTAIETALNKK